ncbi:hypothetical protein [Sphingomonas paeninsulae]|jgi:hypothetical protein|uniref:hypothetical protein n=1 Tax=Sphingomonas paeninsulae TaxID=2319844 RepID=UPI0013CE8507|nr:hypothetical protein [Sphingomonas paeninsulae]
MIDNFSLGLTHLLLLYAAWKLMARPDLDREVRAEIKDQPAPESKLRGWGKR